MLFSVKREKMTPADLLLKAELLLVQLLGFQPLELHLMSAVFSGPPDTVLKLLSVPLTV